MNTRRRYLTIAVFILTVILSGCVKSSEQNEYKPGTIAENRRAVLRSVVNVVAQGLGNIAVNSKGVVDTNLIKKFVTKIRFFNNNSGYFFVNDITDNRIIVNPVDTELVGKSGSNITDSRGNYYFKLMSQRAKIGGGSVDYYVRNPKLNIEQIKETYVKMIPNTDLYLAAGQYINEDAYPRYR